MKFSWLISSIPGLFPTLLAHLHRLSNTFCTEISPPFPAWPQLSSIHVPFNVWQEAASKQRQLPALCFEVSGFASKVFFVKALFLGGSLVSKVNKCFVFLFQKGGCLVSWGLFGFNKVVCLVFFPPAAKQWGSLDVNKGQRLLVGWFFGGEKSGPQQRTSLKAFGFILLGFLLG